MAPAQDYGDLPIVQYWHDPEIPSDVAELIATFRDRNPDMRHMVFSEAEAEEFIADRHTPRELAAFRACAVPAMQADYFRYCAAFTLGGIWADADLLCVGALRGLVEATDSALLFRRKPRDNLVNSFFVFVAPGHPLLRLAIDLASANIERRMSKAVNMVTGPWVFTDLLTLHALGSVEAVQSAAAAAGRVRHAARLLEAVGDFARLAQAFDGVQIEPIEIAGTWIDSPATPPRYKQSDTYWPNWHRRGGTIYR